MRDEQADKKVGALDKMILVVSYGTAHSKARQKDIEGIHIDNLQEALTKAEEKKIKELLIQPTHVMAGIEYQKIRYMVNYSLSLGKRD